MWDAHIGNIFIIAKKSKLHPVLKIFSSLVRISLLKKVEDIELVIFFCFREDMEKVNIKFHDNGTLSYQHKKILKFVPDLSVDKDLKITVPNIPLLVSFLFNYVYF